MIAYHFTTTTLRDGSPLPPIGTPLVHTGPVIPCVSGLHASEHPFDALTYAPGTMLHRVELTGGLVAHGDPPDKHVGRERTILATIDATGILRTFARLCALDVAHLWEAPPVVLHYLRTGDPAAYSAADLVAYWAARSAARSAADLAADLAARSAARSAADLAADLAARSAADLAADLVAYWAARSAAYWAARSAAYWAAHSEALSAQRNRLHLMVDGAFAYQLENPTTTP